MGATAGGSTAAGANETTSPSDILPADHWAHQEADDDDDRDSALGEDDNASSTASISSSILEYRTIHGRTYHSDRGSAEYWSPNDEQQNEAMDINHHLLTLVLDGALYRAPIGDDVKRVLDVGTGTGIWAIDFADQHPDAEVIGTDVSPIQPSWLPPNLHFEIDDATLDWTFKPDHFDFIHLRYLFGSIADWPALYKQAFKCCKPGGYVEDMEASVFMSSDDGTVSDGSPMGQWGKVFREGGLKFGRSFTVVEDDLQRKGFEEAGFTDIDVWDLKCPIGGWPRDKKLREMGLYSHLALTQDIEGFVMYMWSNVMGWTKEEVQVYTAHLRRQLRDPGVHAYFRIRVVYGRKPEASA